jgi:hypothetical protein
MACRRAFLFVARLNVARVVVLIDGSNVIGAMGRAGLGYPALEPLLARVAHGDDLISARFYGNPSPTEPWGGPMEGIHGRRTATSPASIGFKGIARNALV